MTHLSILLRAIPRTTVFCYIQPYIAFEICGRNHVFTDSAVAMILQCVTCVKFISMTNISKQ